MSLTSREQATGSLPRHTGFLRTSRSSRPRPASHQSPAGPPPHDPRPADHGLAVPAAAGKLLAPPEGLEHPTTCDERGSELRDGRNRFRVVGPYRGVDFTVSRLVLHTDRSRQRRLDRPASPKSGPACGWHVSRSQRITRTAAHANAGTHRGRPGCRWALG